MIYSSPSTSYRYKFLNSSEFTISSSNTISSCSTEMWFCTFVGRSLWSWSVRRDHHWQSCTTAGCCLVDWKATHTQLRVTDSLYLSEKVPCDKALANRKCRAIVCVYILAAVCTVTIATKEYISQKKKYFGGHFLSKLAEKKKKLYSIINDVELNTT